MTGAANPQVNIGASAHNQLRLVRGRLARLVDIPPCAPAAGVPPLPPDVPEDWSGGGEDGGTMPEMLRNLALDSGHVAIRVRSA